MAQTHIQQTAILIKRNYCHMEHLHASPSTWSPEAKKIMIVPHGQMMKKSSRTVSRTWSPGRPQKKKGTNAERTLEDGGAPGTTGAQRAARVWNNIWTHSFKE
jgi:hypothetical protein